MHGLEWYQPQHAGRHLVFKERHSNGSEEKTPAKSDGHPHHPHCNTNLALRQIRQSEATSVFGKRDAAKTARSLCMRHKGTIAKQIGPGLLVCARGIVA